MGTMRYVWAFGVAVFLAALVGCQTSTQELAELSLGMSQGDVRDRIGEPTVVRGGVTNRYGQVVEVWEYELERPKTDRQVAREITVTVLTVGLASPILFRGGETRNYWLY